MHPHGLPQVGPGLRARFEHAHLGWVFGVQLGRMAAFEKQLGPKHSLSGSAGPVCWLSLLLILCSAMVGIQETGGLRSTAQMITGQSVSGSEGQKALELGLSRPRVGGQV